MVFACNLNEAEFSPRRDPCYMYSCVSGNIKDLDTRCIHQCLTDLARKYGPVMYIKLFQRNIVVLSDANVLRKAFRSPEYRAPMNNKPKGLYMYNNSASTRQNPSSGFPTK